MGNKEKIANIVLGGRVINMLETPFGNVIVKVNDERIEYQVNELPLRRDKKEQPLFIVNGRYKIMPLLDNNIDFPIRLSISIDCTLDSIDTKRSGLEPGERLFLNSLYRDNQKLSLGVFDELEGLEFYDYSLNGIEIIVTDRRFLEYAYFYVAWITLSGDNYESNGDNYTWFAADPNLV